MADSVIKGYEFQDILRKNPVVSLCQEYTSAEAGMSGRGWSRAAEAMSSIGPQFWSIFVRIKPKFLGAGQGAQSGKSKKRNV
jgi:hypothetical protein